MCRAAWATFSTGTMVVGIGLLFGAMCVVVLLLLRPDAVATVEDEQTQAAGGGGERSLGAAEDVAAADLAPSDDAVPVAPSAGPVVAAPAADPAVATHALSIRAIVFGGTAGSAVAVALSVVGAADETLVVCAVTGYGAGSIALFLAGEIHSGVAWSEIPASISGWRGHHWIATVCMVLHCLCAFSNSFVVNQDAITGFLSASVVLALLVAHVRQGASLPWWTLCQYVLILACIRASRWTGACREEQGPECAPVVFSRAAATFSLLGLLGGHWMWAQSKDTIFDAAWVRFNLGYPLLALSGTSLSCIFYSPCVRMAVLHTASVPADG